jgi:transcriptional regulator with XRE-family HTH domain
VSDVPVDLEARRTAAGLSRKEASDLSGVTQGAIWSLENGKNTRDKSASKKYVDWLVGHEARGVGVARAAVAVAVGGRVVQEEWEGLKPGSTFRIEGEPGTFTFRGHVTEPGGSVFIDCYGGPSGHGRLRCIRPDRVRGRNWKPAPSAEPATPTQEEDNDQDQDPED